MVPLLVISIVIELSGVAGVIFTKWPSLLFFLSQRAIETGFLGILVAVLVWQRGSIEAAFDLGVEVGERRSRRRSKRLVVLPRDIRTTVHRGGKHLETSDR